MLAQGADPNYLIQAKTKLFHSVMTQNNVKIIQSLVHYGLTVDRQFIQDMLGEPGCIDCAKDLITHVLEHYKHVKMLHEIFFALTNSANFKAQSAIDILSILIDHGLPINDLYQYNGKDGGLVTPLHQCIILERIDFVSKF